MWILREIQERGGELDFRDFMELALYHPEHGYYTSGAAPWGKGGDFLTAPTASGWYGATLAGFLAELAIRTGVRCRLMDLAAGDGTLISAVIDGLGDRAVDVLAGVTAVERSRAMRAGIDRRLAGSALEVKISDEVCALGPGPVMVHASELYDAMPVHRVEQTPSGLMEMTVAVEDEGLAWRRRPAGPGLIRYFERHRVRLVDGQIAEANLAAEDHHRATLAAAGEGIVLILDYGYDANRLYDSRGRRHGSLVSYQGHEVSREVLDSPGERDLTAHVNWDDLRRAATSCEWAEIDLMPLAEFLVRAGIAERVDEAGIGIEADLDATTVIERQEIKRLLDPDGMGSDLKVLIQGKGALAEAAKEILFDEI